MSTAARTARVFFRLPIVVKDYRSSPFILCRFTFCILHRIIPPRHRNLAVRDLESTVNHLSPVMATALAPFAPPSSEVHAIAPKYAIGLYRKALASFDWQYDQADTQHRWANGHNDLANLYLLQRTLDPDGSIWLSYPGAHTDGAPQPRVQNGGAA